MNFLGCFVHIVYSDSNTKASKRVLTHGQCIASYDAITHCTLGDDNFVLKVMGGGTKDENSESLLTCIHNTCVSSL